MDIAPIGVPTCETVNDAIRSLMTGPDHPGRAAEYARLLLLWDAATRAPHSMPLADVSVACPTTHLALTS